MSLISKIKGLRHRLLLELYRLLPLQNNTVLFWSFDFNAYSCNPKYIARRLAELYPGKFDICWVFDVSVDVPPDFPYRYVRYFSLEYMKQIATAKVLVCNSRINEKRYCFRKRKGQFYLQTWHGSIGPKHIERDAEAQLDPRYVATAKRDSQICDLMLADCPAFARICRESCWYDGEVLVSGMPRCDLFFQDGRAELRKSLGVPPNVRLAVYAPTFRKDLRDRELLDCGNLCSALKNRFGGDWLVLRSVHPNLRHQPMEEPPHCMLMRDRDIQELIHISEVMVSDYSSAMLDAAMAGKKVFLLAPDLEEYRADERGFYYDIGETPFPLCQSNDALRQSIETFDEQAYQAAVDVFFRRFGLGQDGKASDRAAARIAQVCGLAPTEP